MQYKAKQSKQSKYQKGAQGVGLEEPRCQHLTIYCCIVDVDCVGVVITLGEHNVGQGGYRARR